MPREITRLRMAVTRFLSLPQIKEAYGPLAKYLEMKLEVPVELIVPEGYQASGEALGRGQADIADLVPLTYVRAKAQYPGIRPVLALIADGSPSYAGYIVVRSASRFLSIDDLKGASIAFVDPDSSSGYLYPMYLFRQRGIDAHRYFSRIVFLRTHDKVLDAVLKGEIDAGATYSKALAFTRNRGVNPMDYRIVGKTPRIPHDTFCVRGDLPTAVDENLAAALLPLTTLTQEGREVLGRTLQVNGFFRVTDAHYAGIRKVAQTMGALPRAEEGE